MFILGELPVFERTVTVKMPSSSEADAFETATFKARFQAIDLHEEEAVLAAYMALPPEEQRKSQWPLLRRVLKGWSEVNDNDGRPVEFSPATLETMLGNALAVKGLYDAYTAGVSGDSARLGN